MLDLGLPDLSSLKVRFACGHGLPVANINTENATLDPLAGWPATISSSGFLEWHRHTMDRWSWKGAAFRTPEVSAKYVWIEGGKRTRNVFAFQYGVSAGGRH